MLAAGCPPQSRLRKWLLAGLLIVSVTIASAWLIVSIQPPQVVARVSLLNDIASGVGFSRADHVREFRFPEDHGPHPEFQTEWWYYTGNLETSNGRHFGFQLTFFRRAITSTLSPRLSNWATNQVYFAHFGLTDVQANSHNSTERFERGSIGLAGASGTPYRVWLDDWRADSLDGIGNRVRLYAKDSKSVIDLTLSADKPPVLHGENGYSIKSSGLGNASYYYSLSRLSTEGTMTVNGEIFRVTGLAWMDHEFSTTSLGENSVGWDWFSLQFTDKRELMYFQIRQRDSSIEPLSSGTLIEPDGTSKPIALNQIKLHALQTWKSGESGALYPSKWSLEIPSERLVLTVTPYIEDQEMRVSITYWEGAVHVEGMSNGVNISGKGYVEMTGYAK